MGEDISNSPCSSGIKRVYEGISVDNRGSIEGLKKIRVSVEIDGEGGVVEGSVVEEVGNQNDFSTRGSEPIVNWDFDLNQRVVEAENEGIETDIRECTQIGPVIAERRWGIIDISSDEDEILDNLRIHDKGKEKETEEGFTQRLDLDLGTDEKQWGAEGSSLMGNGERRYSREEKGKGKEGDSWLSLATYPTKEEYAISQVLISFQNKEEERLLQEEEARSQREEAWEAYRREEKAKRFRDMVITHAPYLAHGKSMYGDYYESLEQKKELEAQSTDAAIKLEDLSGPFSSALKIIKDRNIRKTDEQLIEWKALENHISDTRTWIVPSLLDLSLKVLAKNAAEIASLDHVPDWLKQRLVDLLCDSRKMDIHILKLLLIGSPTDIRVKDCSWMTEEQFGKALGKFDMNNLRVLQLDLCGQCSLDDVLYKSLAQSSNSLPCLAILSLRGVCRLSDDTLKALVKSAPLLQSINLGQCSLLTCSGIEILADSLGSSLRELYIDDCPRIDAMLILPSLKKFEHLEVLSVAGIQAVCDEFVRNITTTCGRNIKELDLANCLMLTDSSLEAIGKSCPELCSLNISNLHKLTDLGLHFLSNGCGSVQALKFYRNRFSDEAIAAFLEASGESLTELSLNGVSKVDHSTALSLAKCSRKLSSLDLSWCRRITDEALGLIVDSCLSLRLLKLFGCTQITDIFLNGHSNLLVKIVGLNSTPLLEHINMFEPGEVLLRYSPLQFSEVPM